MQRDMELIRSILLAIDKDPRFDGRTIHSLDAGELGFTDIEPTAFTYHCALLLEAGFLTAPARQPLTGLFISRISWNGHEFLDDIRDPEIWKKTKARAKDLAGIGVGFLWELAKAEVKAKLGLP